MDDKKMAAAQLNHGEAAGVSERAPAPEGWEWMEDDDTLAPEDFVCGLVSRDAELDPAVALVAYSDGHMTNRRMEARGSIPTYVQETAYAEFIRLRGVTYEQD